MDLASWFDGPSTALDINALMNAALRAPAGTPLLPLCVPTGDFGKTASSLEGALLECPPQYRPRDLLLPLPKRSPVYNVPVEILIRICLLVTHPRSRDGLYGLIKLTHVCRFWRMALINQARLWSAVSITRGDRRSFVETCLDRSYPVMLDVTISALKLGKIHSDCTCDKGTREKLLPNESKPCEWHFLFELLAETKHSNRIRALDIELDPGWEPPTEKARLALGSCRFFTSTFPRLVTLTWTNEGTIHADHLFSTPPFVPTLCSLSYVGAWNTLITQVSNLTFFSFSHSFDLGPSAINTEAFRLFMCNNRSLESLVLGWLCFEGDAKGPPVHLLNLKSLNIGLYLRKLSNIIRIPAFQRLSSLRISSEDTEICTITATGDEITITAECEPEELSEIWEHLTGYAKPVIRHIRLHDGPKHIDHGCSENNTVALLMADAHTLEVGLSYLPGWYENFWEDLKQLGMQLKTIRFEISGDMEPCLNLCTHVGLDCKIWDTIEDLVKYRFDQGRLFSAIERLATSESEREDRLQAYVWRCFYGTRKLDRYIRAVQV